MSNPVGEFILKLPVPLSPNLGEYCDACPLLPRADVFKILNEETNASTHLTEYIEALDEDTRARMRLA
ncbi:hypothetical protein [Shimazuella kribbensis]|uniref:hypothetical protein n=1 Tax=Shimazuella kribbensis TaxID=139808 RepID=UPI00048F3F1C|nr:hypothetical protein [Shimazuella kribbensis]